MSDAIKTDTQSPLILTVPGLNNSGLGHWQTSWESELEDCERIDLGSWDRPHRNSWVNRINIAVHNIDRPVILVAHSLGCLAVAWWAALERPTTGGPVIGALLVAPPEVDNFPSDDRLSGFGPAPKGVLPFPSILVASQNDPYIRQDRARRLAFFWGSQFADAGQAGHINAESGLGSWELGKFLLSRLISDHQFRQSQQGKHNHPAAPHPHSSPRASYLLPL